MWNVQVLIGTAHAHCNGFQGDLQYAVGGVQYDFNVKLNDKNCYNNGLLKFSLNSIQIVYYTSQDVCHILWKQIHFAQTSLIIIQLQLWASTHVSVLWFHCAERCQ